MKITYFKLKNFSNIHTALKTREIEIDFSDMKNKICLITGKNGSGKTSILSCLHPFASNGNLDVRSDNPLVLIGEDGYKEIHYQSYDNTYVIKHYYTHLKESHTTKSYIEKNGTELNPNGNVRSFKEIVKDELDIEEDYLKLVRLGSNVTNFIDHKTTERKAFMGKILDEVDVYLKFYKKVSEKMRNVKSIISHLVDKIEKLSISDLNELKKEQEELKEEIEKGESYISQLNNKMSIINYEIEKYDSPLVLKEKLEESIKEQAKIVKILSKKSDESITSQICNDRIQELKTELAVFESNLASFMEKREYCLNRYEKLMEEKDKIEKELYKIENSSEVKDLEEVIQKLKDQIELRNKESKLTGVSYEYTKKDLEELIVVLDKCNDILYTTYEFGKEPIKKAISFILSKSNIHDYVKSNTDKISRNKLQSMCEAVFTALTKNNKIPKPDCKTPYKCDVMKFYDEIYDLATEIPDTVVEDETFVMYTKMANQNISTILDYIKSKKSILDKLPNSIKELFTVKNIFERMENLKPLYDKEILYGELSKVTEYELQEADLHKLSELKDKLKLVKSSIGNTEYFKNRSQDIQKEMDDVLEENSSITDSINSITKSISDLKLKIESLEELKESIDKKDTIDLEVDELKKSYEILKERLSEKSSIDQDIYQSTYKLNKLKKDYNDNDYRIKSFESFNKELMEYNSTYDEMELVKRSLSSKEGIPLLYIQVYLKNIQEITNELLDIIYDGELFIEDFNITADEFKIPYVTKETKIKDVCYASQGERSFISLALSFSLIYQSISRYNILLLDEIDSTLDTVNREKFLMILEKYIDMIECEQVFLITHNNMFNMYPVDIIDTKNKEDEINRLANYIKIKIK